MAKLEDIEKAVSELPADQLAQFRNWFEEFEAARFDRKIEQDVHAGRLDQLVEQALADYPPDAPASCEALRQPVVLGSLCKTSEGYPIAS